MLHFWSAAFLLIRRMVLTALRHAGAGHADLSARRDRMAINAVPVTVLPRAARTSRRVR